MAFPRLFPARPVVTLPREFKNNGHSNGHGESKAVTILPRMQFWLNGAGQPVTSSPDLVAGTAAYTIAALAYICIKYRATKIREAPLMVVEETDAGEEWIPDHELNPLLSRANPDYGSKRLIEITEIALATTGRCLWVKNRGRAGQVVSLYPFDGDSFSVESANGRLFGRFKIGNQYYNPEDVCYFSYVDPTDPLGGLSPLRAAMSSLNIGQNLQQRVTHYVKNAMMPGGIYVADKDWKATDSEFERLKFELASMLQGVNSGKPGVAEGGGKIEKGWSLAELALGELWREVEATVCGCFGVPASLVGTVVGLENSPWSHMDTAKRSFYDETVLPEWEFMEEVITESLLREVDDNAARMIRFDTTRIRALQKDWSVQANIAATAAKWTSVNERRMLTGQEPVDDPKADEIPELNPPPAPVLMPAADPTARAGVADDAKARFGLHQVNLAVIANTLDQNENVWELVVKGLLEKDRAEISALILSEAKSHGVIDAIMSLVDDYLKGLGLDRWMLSVAPLVHFTSQSAVKNLVVSGAKPARLSPERIQQIADRTATWLIKHVSDTTRQAVKKALQEGFEAGDPVAKVARRIAELPEFTRDRAKLIARTETIRAYNHSQLDAIKGQSEAHGVKFTKKWVATTDDRTRDSHSAVNQEVKALDEQFSNGCSFPGDPSAPPAETCNCRCVLTYSVAGAS